MAARFLLSVATICCAAIFVQESSGSCIRRGGLLDNPQCCVCGERSSPESSLDCSSISRNSARDHYESSYSDSLSSCGFRQQSRYSGDNEMEVQLPRKSCPMHGYIVDDPPKQEPEPCKAYGVMVAIPKPTVKACCVSSSHKYEVEKATRERMEQRRAYGIAVATPRRVVSAPACQVHDYKVERPKEAKKEEAYAYGVAVVNVPEPEPCLPCMDDDNVPDEGFYDPPGPCCPCVDDEPGFQVQEPQTVSLPRSGGCKSCSMSSGAQAGGYYYGETRKSSSSSNSCHSYEQRYEGRRDGPARESGVCHSTSYDDQENSEEEDLGKAYGDLRTTGNICRPSQYFQGATVKEDYEDSSCESSIAHSTFCSSGCPPSSDYQRPRFEWLKPGCTM